jgi:hypothetical protein
MLLMEKMAKVDEQMDEAAIDVTILFDSFTHI